MKTIIEEKEYKTQLVKQIHISKDGQYQTCRWDNVKKVLMFQNRSYDMEMSLDDFLNRLDTTIKRAKAKGFQISIKDVAIGSKWPTESEA